MKKFKKKPIVLFTVAVIILYVIIYIVPKVTGAMVSSYTAGYGELKLSDETSAYIVRNEHVYTAGTGGKVNRYIGNGTLVRAGTTILKVTGDSARQPADEYEGILKSLGADAISTENYSVEKGESSVITLMVLRISFVRTIWKS